MLLRPVFWAGSDGGKAGTIRRLLPSPVRFPFSFPSRPPRHRGWWEVAEAPWWILDKLFFFFFFFFSFPSPSAERTKRGEKGARSNDVESEPFLFLPPLPIERQTCKKKRLARWSGLLAFRSLGAGSVFFSFLFSRLRQGPGPPKQREVRLRKLNLFFSPPFPFFFFFCVWQCQPETGIRSSRENPRPGKNLPFFFLPFPFPPHSGRAACDRCHTEEHVSRATHFAHFELVD